MKISIDIIWISIYLQAFFPKQNKYASRGIHVDATEVEGNSNIYYINPLIIYITGKSTGFLMSKTHRQSDIKNMVFNL